MELQVISADETCTHLALAGKLDIMGVGEIENKFLDYTAKRKTGAVIDLSGVTFTGSMGLRLFLSAAKALHREKKKLVLLNPRPMVKVVLDESGIGDVVLITSDPDQALAAAQA
jgi:anti-sigma B factor antagonist